MIWDHVLRVDDFMVWMVNTSGLGYMPLMLTMPTEKLKELRRYVYSAESGRLLLTIASRMTRRYANGRVVLVADSR